MNPTNAAQHTPTPWANLPSGQNMAGNYSQPYCIVEHGKPNIVAGCFGDVAGGQQTAAANAAFIVEACNNYERVLAERDEAVKELRDLLRCVTTDGFGIGEAQRLATARNAARAILAKLEGK